MPRYCWALNRIWANKPAHYRVWFDLLISKRNAFINIVTFLLCTRIRLLVCVFTKNRLALCEVSIKNIIRISVVVAVGCTTSTYTYGAQQRRCRAQITCIFEIISLVDYTTCNFVYLFKFSYRVRVQRAWLRMMCVQVLSPRAVLTTPIYGGSLQWQIKLHLIHAVESITCILLRTRHHDCTTALTFEALLLFCIIKKKHAKPLELCLLTYQPRGETKRSSVIRLRQQCTLALVVVHNALLTEALLVQTFKSPPIMTRFCCRWIRFSHSYCSLFTKGL